MNILKPEAIKLRDDGYSYSYISRTLGISLSTLSSWLRDRPYVPNQFTLDTIAQGQREHGRRQRERRQSHVVMQRNEGIKEIGELSQRDVWMLGLGLWLGEGSKTIEQIRLANSDPRVVALWIWWLREICGAKNHNITVRLHIYHDNNEEACIDYWMNITGLPRSQFRTAQIDKRISRTGSLKKNKLPYGTLHITLVSGGDPSMGVSLYRKLLGWIEATTILGAG